MKKKILVIEDDEDNRGNVSEILSLAGYEVFESCDGRHGIETAVRVIPDVIVSDIMMENVDGYEVIRFLSLNPTTRHIPFVFMSALGERSDLRSGMDAGADDYLTKPFSEAELLNSIASRLRKNEDQRAFYTRSFQKLKSFIEPLSGFDELKKILLSKKKRTVKAGQVVYSEGDRSNGVFLVLSGTIKTIQLEEDGRQLMTGLYRKDEYLGLVAALSLSPYADTATTMVDSVLCSIPKEDFEKLISSHSDVSRDFIRLLAGENAEKQEQMISLAFHSVRKRLAEAIIRFVGKADISKSVRIPRDDLAAMAGIATETVSRTLTDFKDEGLIHKEGNLIHILKYESLLEMRN